MTNNSGLAIHPASFSTNEVGKTKITRDSRKYFFSHRVVGRWNSLDQEMVDAPSINAFKGRFDKVRQTRVDFLWTNPLSPRPLVMINSPVRPQEVRYNVPKQNCPWWSEPLVRSTI